MFRQTLVIFSILGLLLYVSVVSNLYRGIDASIRVHYPVDMLRDHQDDWFSIAKKSNLINQTNYRNLALAQSGEDIWAYENWFWRMANGTMLESGALDGIKFSTSYLFEKLASWRIIHIGTIAIN